MNNNIINEIRSKTDIVDIIGSYLPLIKKGKNYFGVCPFHDDNNPSMSVSREKQIYRCFSCGASGNVFNFIMNYEHLTFKETIELLAKKTGVALKGISIQKDINRYQDLYAIHDLAHRFYINNINSKLGISAKEYLMKRSIDENIIKEFGIGLATTNLTPFLIKKGYSITALNNAGISSQNNDVFNNRIMFPLCDLKGAIVGFSGRIYENNNSNKYVNTKETQIFKKGLLLYNYHKALEEVRLKHQVIVLEGFMDVIRLYSVGIKNVIALMGTAMTKEQASLIHRMSCEVILCFDGDEAGRHATQVNGEQLVNMGINVKVIELINNEDPDTYIINSGVESFKRLIENALSFVDYKIKSLKKGVNFKSDIEKANYIDAVVKETSMIGDDIRKEIILKNLAIETNLSYNTLEKRLKEYSKNKTKLKGFLETNPVQHLDKYEKATRELLYYMLLDEKVINIVNKKCLIFPNETSRLLADEINYYYKKYGLVNLADFYTYLNEKKELLAYLNIIINTNICDNCSSSVIDDYISVIQEYCVSQEMKRLENLIRNEADPLKQAKIGEEIRKLKMGSV